MPRPKLTKKNDPGASLDSVVCSKSAYANLEASQFAAREEKDCGVKALAHATGEPYERVHKLLSLQGREKGKGTSIWMQKVVADQLGYYLEEISQSWFVDRYPKPHCDVLVGVTTHHPFRFAAQWPKGTYLLLVSGGRHIACVKDGVLADWSVGRALRACKIFEVVKI